VAIQARASGVVTWAAVGVFVTALGAVAGLLVFMLGAVREDIRNLRGDLGVRLDRVDVRLDRIESTVLREHGERIARLEERAER
jgi:hypothetical protein